jgi:hypothetical protein
MTVYDSHIAAKSQDPQSVRHVVGQSRGGAAELRGWLTGHGPRERNHIAATGVAMASCR